ncbi:methylamine utilization protein [Undibacterium sp. JH2W]|uniref:methylamine utilization protein n=1 Tax=Undibacterium sp. JH2W TaxID=3413037 RepID=UPI003BF0B8C8
MKPLFLQAFRLVLPLVMGVVANLPLLAHAAKLNFQAVDKNGNAMADVVVYATPIGMPLPASEKTEATIAQADMQFSPYVTAIRTGSLVKFPNYDKMEHHVKSFSAIKEFEIKTYERGVVPPPVIFDKPGIVIVYCLLHNWMRAYVMVLDTPYFVKTDQNGAAILDHLPDGNYEIKAWHPNLGSIKPALSQTVKVNEQSAPVKWQFDFVPVPRKSKSAAY